MNGQISQYIASFSTIRLLHPICYRVFSPCENSSVREKLNVQQIRVKSSDATQTLDDQALANSDIYSALHKLSSYASSTHSHVRLLYHLYRSCPYTVTELMYCIIPNPIQGLDRVQSNPKRCSSRRMPLEMHRVHVHASRNVIHIQFTRFAEEYTQWIAFVRTQ